MSPGLLNSFPFQSFSSSSKTPVSPLVRLFSNQNLNGVGIGLLLSSPPPPFSPANIPPTLTRIEDFPPPNLEYLSRFFQSPPPLSGLPHLSAASQPKKISSLLRNITGFFFFFYVFPHYFALVLDIRRILSEDPVVSFAAYVGLTFPTKSQQVPLPGVTLVYHRVNQSFSAIASFPTAFAAHLWEYPYWLSRATNIDLFLPLRSSRAKITAALPRLPFLQRPSDVVFAGPLIFLFFCLLRF